MRMCPLLVNNMILLFSSFSKERSPAVTLPFSPVIDFTPLALLPRMLNSFSLKYEHIPLLVITNKSLSPLTSSIPDIESLASNFMQRVGRDFFTISKVETAIRLI